MNLASEFPILVAKAAANLVLFSGRRPGRPPFSPPGFRTSVQYMPPTYRVGRQRATHVEGQDFLDEPVSETTDPGIAAKSLMEGWITELGNLNGEPFQTALRTIFMTAEIEPPE